MFLQVMNREEREKFLELIYKVANIEGEYAEEEKELIDSYKNELELTEILDTGNIEGLIEYFSSKTTEMKKIILFEVIGLINVDDKIVKEEEDIFKKLVESFGVDNESVEKIEMVAKKLQQVYDEVYDILFE